MFSRATWVLSYYSGKMSGWIRQNVEIWSLDVTWFVTPSASTQGWRLYGINDISSQLPMTLQSYYHHWKVGTVCQPHAQVAMAGSWTRKHSNAKHELDPRMVMFSPYWGVRGMICCEVLPTDSTITTDFYRQQLEQVGAKLRENQHKINFYMATSDLILQSQWVKMYWSSDGRRFHIHRILRTRPLPTTICSILFLIICARKSSMTKTTSKSTPSIFSAKSSRTSMNAGSFLHHSFGEKSYILMEHTLLKNSRVFQVKN